MKTKKIISFVLSSSLTLSLIQQPLIVLACPEINDFGIEVINVQMDNIPKKQKITVSSESKNSDTDNVIEYGAITKDDMYESIANQYKNLMCELESTKDEDKLAWYLKYKEFISSYTDMMDLPETIYDYYSENEISYMQRVVETETHGADFISKTHVASVILNRIAAEEFSNDAISVITAEGQFAYHKTNITEETVLALEYAFEIEDTTDGAVYFHSNSYSPTFNKATYHFTDDVGHHFYVNE